MNIAIWKQIIHSNYYNISIGEANMRSEIDYLCSISDDSNDSDPEWLKTRLDEKPSYPEDASKMMRITSTIDDMTPGRTRVFPKLGSSTTSSNSGEFDFDVKRNLTQELGRDRKTINLQTKNDMYWKRIDDFILKNNTVIGARNIKESVLLKNTGRLDDDRRADMDKIDGLILQHKNKMSRIK